MVTASSVRVTGLVVWAAALAPGACTCAAESPQRACVSADDCGADEVCADGVCAASCGVDRPCPDGACVVEDDVAHCAPSIDDREDGVSCQTSEQCRSGACAGNQCVPVCTLDVPCPDDLLCVLDDARRICIRATDDRAVGVVCENPRQCASGVCVRPFDGGDPICAAPCDDRHPCAVASDVCALLEHGSRACLAPLEDGEACTGGDACAGGFCIVDDRVAPHVARCASACVDGACDPAAACVIDDAGNRVCMPAVDQRADGDVCVDNRDCASRLCIHFVDGADLDARLCASPCPAGGCGPDRVCWEGDDVDVCGPIP